MLNSKTNRTGNSLAIQWLGLHISTAGGTSSISDGETKISQAEQHSTAAVGNRGLSTIPTGHPPGQVEPYPALEAPVGGIACSQEPQGGVLHQPGSPWRAGSQWGLSLPREPGWAKLGFLGVCGGGGGVGGGAELLSLQRN